MTRSGDGGVVAGAKTARVVKKHKEVSMIDDDDDDDDSLNWSSTLKSSATYSNAVW